MDTSSICAFTCSSPVTNPWKYTFIRRGWQGLPPRHTPRKSTKTTSICTWPTTLLTRKTRGSSRMRIQNRTILVTSGVWAPFANIWSRLASTWICFGPASTTSFSRRYSAVKTTCKQLWRKMGLTALIASNFSALTFWLTPTWNRGWSRLIWVRRWPENRPSTCQSSQICSVTPSIWLAWSVLTAKRSP